MDRIEALEEIKRVWDDKNVDLGEKILTISTAFHSAGLNLATTAAYIKATPIELDSLLALGELDDDIISTIARVNPPKTTWTMLASASDEEIEKALKALELGKGKTQPEGAHYTASEFVYQTMMEISGPTMEQKVASLSGDDLKHALKKGEDFNILNDWEKKFLKSVAAQKKRGKVPTDKQVASLIKALMGLVTKGAIVRNSIDGDQEICDRILDALGID